MKASSTTTSRPGRQQGEQVVDGVQHARSGWWGCRPRPGRRPAGTAPGSSAKPSSARVSTAVTRCPACSSAACGSVNCGCTTTGRRHGRSRATSEKASAAPAVASTSSAGRSWRSGDRLLGGARVGVGADVVEAGAQRGLEPDRAGTGVDVDGEVEQAGAADLGVAVVAQRVGSVRCRAQPRCTASTKRCASCGCPAQCTCRYDACRLALVKPTSCPSPLQAGAGPATGSTWVRWNSWPVTRSPARVSSESETAVTSG